MNKVKLLSAVLFTAATFATPALAASHTSRHLATDTRNRVVSTEPRYDGDGCIRAPRVGAFATQPWTYAAPCMPYEQPYMGY